MQRGLGIAFALLMAIAGGRMSIDPALAQARVFAFGTPEDNTNDLQLRAIQAGKIDPRSVPSPCKTETSSGAGASASRNKRPGSNTGYPAMVVAAPAHDCTFTDVVAIVYYDTNGRRSRCSGVLVSDRMILTAAHCTCGIHSTYRILTAKGMRETGGLDAKIEASKNTDEIYLLSDRPAIFDGYDCNLSPMLQAGRDLALLRVVSVSERRSIDQREGHPFEAKTFGIVVATPGMIARDAAETKWLIGAGFGYIDDGTLPNKMRFGAIQIASLFCGQEQFAGTPCRGGREFVLANTVAGGRGTDTCGGDSGGPIFYAANARSVALVGITSRALGNVNHRADLMCGGGGIYTTVGHPAVANWLKANGVDVLLKFEDGEAADR